MESDLTIAQHEEFSRLDAFIERRETSGNVVFGPRDDAAVLHVQHDNVLVSTDVLVEGEHFRRDWSTAAQIGRKAAAVNLSDIGAMGGVADALTVGFAAPGNEIGRAHV